MAELATNATKVLTERALRPIVRAIGVAYVRFERPDLDRACRFFADFGLTQAQRDGSRVFLRCAGEQPYVVEIMKGRKPRFAGLGLLVGSRKDLVALSELPGASAIEKVTDPGGGERVRLRDPGGIRVDVLWDRVSVAPLPKREPLVANAPGKICRVNRGQRPALLPPTVHKLGHVVLESISFRRSLRWYLDTFGLIATDVLCLPDGTASLAFLRFDLGDQPADHHSVVISTGLETGLNHCAFEVTDLDAVGVGQQVLQAGGWSHAWGIGRHLLGSQVFDYWADPWEEKFEHYADGDVFTSDYETGYHAMDQAGLYQWGPDVPSSFLMPKLSAERVIAMARNLAGKNELDLSRLRQLQKAMSRPARPWLG